MGTTKLPLSGGGAVDSVNTRTGAVVLDKTDVDLDNVDNTSDVNKPISSATQTALDLKAPIASPTFTGTVSGITKTMVGLGNVDNTSDANKPISTATQTALDAKLSSVAGGDHTTLTNIGTNSHATIDSHIASTSNPHSVTKAQVSLGNCDNTSDANKPISTATQTALDAKAPLASPIFTTAVTVNEVSTPSTPASGGAKLYPKSDNLFYQLNDGGIEKRIANDLMSNLINNLGVEITLNANALTMTLTSASGATLSATNRASVAVRSSTLATGQYNIVDITSALATTISSGSTGGSVSGLAARYYGYVISNAGTPELAWSRSIFDDSQLVSTTAEGGSGGSDSNSVMYSTTARSNVSHRLIFTFLMTQATAGAHVTQPSEISLAPFILPKLVCSYTTNAGQSISNNTETTVVLEDRVDDNYNAMNTSTGIFTSPKVCKLRVMFTCHYAANAGWEAGEYAANYIRLNSSIKAGALIEHKNTPTSTYEFDGGVVFYTTPMAIGDTFDFRTIQTSDGAIALVADGAFNRVSIEEV